MDGEKLIADVTRTLRTDRFVGLKNLGGVVGALGGIAGLLTPGRVIEAAGVVNVGERAAMLALAGIASSPEEVVALATKGLGSRGDFEKAFNEEERAHFIQNFPTVGYDEESGLTHRPTGPRDFTLADRFKELTYGGVSSRVLKDWQTADPRIAGAIRELVAAAAAQYGGTQAELGKTATVVRVGNVHEDYGYAVVLSGDLSDDKLPEGMQSGKYTHTVVAVFSPEGKALAEPVGSIRGPIW